MDFLLRQSPGLVVMGDDSYSKGRGSESRRHILYGPCFTLICCKNRINLCLKRPKINEKEAGVGPFVKKTVPMMAWIGSTSNGDPIKAILL